MKITDRMKKLLAELKLACKMARKAENAKWKKGNN